MPRAKGHDGKVTELLEALENARMNVGRRLYEAREIQIRLRQARQRTRGALDDLIEPGEQRLNEQMDGLEGYAREIEKAIKTLLEH